MQDLQRLWKERGSPNIEKSKQIIYLYAYGLSWSVFHFQHCGGCFFFFSPLLPVNVCCKFSFEWFLSEGHLIWLVCFPCMWHSYEFQYKEMISSAPDVFKCAFNRHNQSISTIKTHRLTDTLYYSFFHWADPVVLFSLSTGLHACIL